MTQFRPATPVPKELLLRDGFAWKEDHLLVLDHRQTPEYEIYLSFTRTQEIAHAIRVGIVTDPDIIIKACCCGLYLAALRKQNTHDWRQALKADFEVLYKVVQNRSECVHILDQTKDWVLQTTANPAGTSKLLNLLHRQVHQLCL